MKYLKHLRSCCRPLFGLFILLLLFCSCKRTVEEVVDSEVRLALRSEPDRLNLLLARTAYATEVGNQLFQSLLTHDPSSLDLQPLLAQSRPKRIAIENGPWQGGVRYDFEIRKEARWDDGQPVLASDVLFTLKAIFNPEIPAAHYRSFLDFIRDVKIDPNNPRSFSVYCQPAYILGEAALGMIPIYPEYSYDPKQALRSYPLPVLLTQEGFEQDTMLSRFAKTFTSPAGDRIPGHVGGSGPYQLKEWQDGQQIRLEKKTNWWGDPLAAQVEVLTAKPNKIVYQILGEEAFLESLLKAGEIDAAASIPPKVFKDLENNELIRKNYDLYSPMQLAYYYIGFYTKNPKLSDRRVRRALAHLVNVPLIIDQLLYGLAEPVVGPVHPAKTFYHKGLKPITFAPEKARALLTEAGWADSNGNGTLDKQMEGRQVEMELTYKLPQGNRVGEQIGLMLQEKAKQLGVKINLEAKNFNQLIGDYRRRDFEMVYLRLSKPPGLEDLKQSWHRSSDTSGGSNRVGFGNATSDALIDSIRQSFDSRRRDSLYQKIQEIIYEEQPCIFLYCPYERIALRKKLQAQASVCSPGFFPQYFYH